MRVGIFFIAFASLLLRSGYLIAQNSFEPGNRIELEVTTSVIPTDSLLTFQYALRNRISAKQEVVEFSLICSPRLRIQRMKAPQDWEIVTLYEDILMIRWIAEPNDETEGYKGALKPGESWKGFSFATTSLPDIITYYAEGNHPIPKFPPGMATDSIPGYSDLTPYGPGIVGKTVGPVLPPTPFIATAFLDTLISFKHQSVALAWLRDRREEERDEDDEEKEDGIVTRLDKRLDKVRGALVKGDSAKGRQELEKFVKKVEKLRKRSEEAEQRQKNREVMMTGEAYALLKFNAEYLIDRLPIKQKKGKEKGKSEQ